MSIFYSEAEITNVDVVREFPNVPHISIFFTFFSLYDWIIALLLFIGGQRLDKIAASALFNAGCTSRNVKIVLLRFVDSWIGFLEFTRCSNLDLWTLGKAYEISYAWYARLQHTAHHAKRFIDCSFHFISFGIYCRWCLKHAF